jgi:hypothetical protein
MSHVLFMFELMDSANEKCFFIFTDDWHVVENGHLSQVIICEDNL